jgi:CDP-4-dehydro-6-deoxyglucose reductase, E3
MQNYLANIVHCKAINSDVYHVRLKAPADKTFDYQAGQYLLINMAEDDSRPYSIASMPGSGEFLEMHIRNIPGNQFSTEVLDKLQTAQQLSISLPCGRCTLDRVNAERPLLFIAGGTGFAPFNAMINQAFADNFGQAIHLYWGANLAEELYMLEEVQSWQQANFHFTPVVQQPANKWQHATGLVHLAALSDIEQLANFNIFIGGSSAMVFNVYRTLRNKGVPANQIFSDMLDIVRDTGEQLP